MLASDSDLLLRPEIHRTSAYSSSPPGRPKPTGERPTGDASSVKIQETDRASKVGRSGQPQYQGPYPAHLQDSTVRPCQKDAPQPSRHVRT